MSLILHTVSRAHRQGPERRKGYFSPVPNDNERALRFSHQYIILLQSMNNERDWIELIASDAPLFADRRSEPRLPAEGQVKVSLAENGAIHEFHADLVNFSQRGMCIRHTFTGLKPCQALRVVSNEGEVEVEVAWNWAVGAVIISGLRSIS
jgi:hypothetical protein